MSAPLLAVDSLDFAHTPDKPLFTGLSVALGAERAGLVGANGCGKTTLLRLLLGELPPGAGTVTRRGRLFHLAQLPDPQATVADVLGVADRLASLRRVLAGGTDPADFDGVGTGWDLEERVAAALAAAGVPGLDPDRRLATLSGGQATRARLAAIHLDRPDMLILDEPTNDLDADGRAALYALVAGWTGGLLAVSHDRTLLDLMDRILELSTLGLRAYGGNYTSYRAAKALEVAAAERRLSDAEKEADRVRRAAREAEARAARRARIGKAKADGSQPKMALNAMRECAENHAGRLKALAGRQEAAAAAELDAARAELERRRALTLALPSTGLPAGRMVLRLEGVTARHPGATAPAIRDLSLTLTGPERLAVTGSNGSGKSTLLAVMAGRMAAEAGTVHRGVERIALLDQRLTELDPTLRVLDLFRRRNPDRTDHEARAALATFQFRNDAALARTADLSGGQRLRAVLAATLTARHPPQLLLLDEPTNHLDLDSLEALEAALRGYDGALVVVSHDPRFLEAVGVDRALDLGGPD